MRAKERKRRELALLGEKRKREGICARKAAEKGRAQAQSQGREKKGRKQVLGWPTMERNGEREYEKGDRGAYEP